MLRAIFACVLALATCGHAADTVIYYGPAGEVLAAGKYTRVTISWVNGQAVMTQQVVLDVGGGPVPPGPPVPPTPPTPPVDDLAAKITSYLAAVVDPAKTETQAKLSKGYKGTLTFADAGTITDADSLKTIQQTVDKQLIGKAAAAWRPWTDGMTALVVSLDLQGTIAAYRIAQGQLGGGPLPPPNPPTPPPTPVTTAVSALILMPPEAPDQALSLLTNQARNDKAWSKKIMILNSDAKDENKQPDPLVTKALAYLENRPLPRLLLLDAAGSFVGDEAVPVTWEAAKAYLTQKGVKP